MGKEKTAKTGWKKSPPELVDLFAALALRLQDVEQRKMFGYPAGFVAGRMCCGLFQDRFILRLSEKDRAAAAARLGARPFEPSPGRTMGEFVEVPRPAIGDGSALLPWLRRSRAYTASLPQKPLRRRCAETGG
jgi:hypothetical protein